MKFNLEEHKGKYVMHCKTLEEAEDFCKFLHENSRKWASGDSYVDSLWDICTENSVYYFNKGTVGTMHIAKNNNYKILEWSNYMNNT